MRRKHAKKEHKESNQEDDIEAKTEAIEAEERKQNSNQQEQKEVMSEKIKTLLIDPPWKLCTGGKKSLAVHTHYPVQTQKEIITTVKNWLSNYVIADESHLYVWTINSYSSGYTKGIEDALSLCREIGYKPITNIVWIKDKSNPTPYGQRQTELCIFATRHRKGYHKRIMYRGTEEKENVAAKKLLSSVDYIRAERSKHSKKPDSFYEYIENRSEGPYIELYARNKRKHWISIGNEIT